MYICFAPGVLLGALRNLHPKSSVGVFARIIQISLLAHTSGLQDNQHNPTSHIKKPALCCFYPHRLHAFNLLY